MPQESKFLLLSFHTDFNTCAACAYKQTWSGPPMQVCTVAVKGVASLDDVLET